nr:MAG TPA: hypothetical protein [Caudoviricetes sp.]
MADSKNPSLCRFGDNLVLCKNGALLDETMPDQIIPVSDTTVKFVYGSRTFQLSWEKEESTDVKKNIRLVEVTE